MWTAWAAFWPKPPYGKLLYRAHRKLLKKERMDFYSAGKKWEGFGGLSSVKGN